MRTPSHEPFTSLMIHCTPHNTTACTMVYGVYYGVRRTPVTSLCQFPTINPSLLRYIIIEEIHNQNSNKLSTDPPNKKFVQDFNIKMYTLLGQGSLCYHLTKNLCPNIYIYIICIYTYHTHIPSKQYRAVLIQ